MQIPPIPADERERLVALRALGILDTPAEERFDRIIRVATATFDVPIALISLVDEHRQWFKSCMGLDVEQTDREVAFCAYTILQAGPLVVPDAAADPRFAENPLVTGPPHIRFYAGHPVRSADGYAVGTLCLIDREPRELTDDELALLGELAAMAERELQLSALTDAAYARSELAAVTDAVVDGIITADADGIIRSANASAAQMFGVAAGSLAGRNVAELVPPDLRERHEEQRRAYVARGGDELVGREVSGLRADGTTFPMDLAVTTFDHAGVRRYIATVRDITERKRTEEERRRFFTLSLELLAIANFDGYFLDVNPAWTETLGFSRDELTSRPYLEFVHPDDRERTAEVSDALDGGEPVLAFENRYLCRDGSYRWLRWSAAILVEQELVYSVASDVTEQRRTELALRESEELYRSVIAALDEGIVIQSLDGAIESCNTAAERILGLTADQMAGRASVDPRWRSVKADGTPFPGGEHPAMVCLATGEPQRDVLMGVHKPNDELRWISINSQPLRGPDGETLTGVVSSFTDISERIALDQMKTEFVSVVSHELRTPLTAIRGALGLVAGGSLGELTPKAERMVEIASGNAERLIRLINDILDIERMESGAETFTKRGSDAAELLRTAAEGLAPIAAKAGVSVEVDAEPAPLWVDPDRIVQTITNLLQNAITFSGEGSTVRLTARRDRAEVVIAVADEGRGIPASKLAGVFERFQQADASDAREKGGTGLGLTISRSIVEQHGGRIWVESEEGRGSTFTLTLPVLDAEPPPARNGSAPGRDAAGAGGGEPRPARILLVEDDAGLAGTLIEGLSRRGLHVDLAATAAEATALARSDAPDLVILDVELPDGNGLDLIDALRAEDRRATTAVVVYSARDLDAPERERLRSEGIAVMTKGRVAPDEFEQRVLDLVATSPGGAAERAP